MNLFIGKGWPAINQGRKPKGFWENEKLREKRKVSAKYERFYEKRKVSRENREVSLLVKWPAINRNTLNVWPALRQRFGTISKIADFRKSVVFSKKTSFSKNDITLYFHN